MEAIDPDDHGHIEFTHIFNMFRQIGKAFFHGVRIFRLQVRFFYAAVHFKGTDGGDYNDRIRLDAGKTAGNIHKLFGPQIGAETGFRNRNIPRFHS